MAYVSNSNGHSNGQAVAGRELIVGFKGLTKGQRAAEMVLTAVELTALVEPTNARCAALATVAAPTVWRAARKLRQPPQPVPVLDVDAEALGYLS